MAEWYGSLLNSGMSLEYIEARETRIRTVTADDVKRVMNKYITGKPFVDATLLPEAR
jgi:predicted Zn-dependent peptidase